MAGTSVVADVQYALAQNEQFVGDRMMHPNTSVIMALFKKATLEDVKGRGLTALFDSQTRGHSGSGYVAENGDMPSPGRAATQQNSITARLGAMAVEFSDAQMQAMRTSSSAKNLQNIGKILQGEVNTQRERILADFFTRDDSVKAKCAAAVSGSTTVYSSIPIRFVAGDKVYSYPDSSSGDARELDTTPVTTATYVMDIDTDVTDVNSDYTGGRITLSTAVTYEDQSVLVLPGAAIATSILGIESHFDNVIDGTFQWDADDGATVNHGTETGAVPYYAGLERSAYANLNCGVINANGNPLSLNYLTRAAQRSIQKGGQRVQRKLMAMMHPLQYDRFLVTQEGKTKDSNDVQINGQSFTLPYIATGTAERLTVVTTPMFKDGVVAIFPSDCLHKAFSAVGWDETMNRQTAASGSGYSASRINYWTYWLNTYCDLPVYATLIYGLNTDNV